MTKKEYLEQIKTEREELSIDTNLSNEELWICENCGSLDIEQQVWAMVNTGEVTDFCGTNECFCNNCQTHLRCIIFEDFLLKLKK